MYEAKRIISYWRMEIKEFGLYEAFYRMIEFYADQISSWACHKYRDR